MSPRTLKIEQHVFIISGQELATRHANLSEVHVVFTACTKGFLTSKKEGCQELWDSQPMFAMHPEILDIMQ